jgi:crooked neck
VSLGYSGRLYESAVDVLADGEEESGMLLVAFGKFEEEFHEVERAHAIYKYALDKVPKRRAEQIHEKLLALEKQFGDPKGIEDAIVAKRRLECQDDVRKNPICGQRC